MNKKKQRYGNPAKRRELYGDLLKLAQPTGIANPRKLGGTIVGGSPREQGTALLDLTDVVLMESMDVATVDRIKDSESQGQAIFMTLSGRINKKTDHASVGFIFGSDGAAALITELLSLADRFGVDMLTDITERLVTLKQEKNVDLHFLKAAIDLALEEE
jgi:hypothetical protein